MNEEVVTVARLRDLFESGLYDIEIDTPDGYQPVTRWFNKGTMPLLRITLENGLSTTCAARHLLQRADNDWMLASELTTFDSLHTVKGESRVASIEDAGEGDCFDFEVDHPNHRYWGDGLSSHNSGKSYIVSGNIIRNALAQGIHVVVIDTEDALRHTWMTNLGVDTNHPNLVKEVCATINQVVNCIDEWIKPYHEAFRDTPREQQQKILFVIDSLGMLQTEAEIEQFAAHELKGDKGIKAKALKMLVTNCIRLFSGYEIGLVATSHTYKSQDPYAPDDVISGGTSFLFAPSIVVQMNKFKLKKDEEGKKTTDVRGIRSKLKVVKTRFSKPFEEIEINIPYDTGMSPYSGLFDMCEQKRLFGKSGAYYTYKNRDGKDFKLYRKDMDGPFYDMVMNEWDDTRDRTPVGVGYTVDEDGVITDVE